MSHCQFVVSRGFRVLCCFLLVLTFVSAEAISSDWSFDIVLSPKIREESFSGRVYLMFQKGTQGEPRQGPNWFNPEPILAQDVRNWKPGEKLTLSSKSPSDLLMFPANFDDVKFDGLRVQAIARLNPRERDVGEGAGNGYSAIANVELDNKTAAHAELTIDTLVKPREFVDTQWSKLLEAQSELLSKFYGYEVKQRAAVVLPASYYDQPGRRYPVVFSVSGFGGDHFAGMGKKQGAPTNPEGVEFIWVYLDADCPLGHHVFADSANNGPVGKALIEEFIPLLDSKYRTVAEPGARYLTGHSSGGWSTLWLQVTYPEVFGGCWSTSPDSVDFRDFQRINMYDKSDNMYRDSKGERRPIARIAGRVVAWYDTFDQMEDIMGPGGQLHSFEAVFSPRGKDGKPLRAWNRKTGEIDVSVTRHWEAYDIQKIIENKWTEKAEKLAGKIHVFMGTEDTFYLDGATEKLKLTVEKLKADAVVEMYPGKDHSSIMTPELRARMQNEMVATFVRNFPKLTDEIKKK